MRQIRLTDKDTTKLTTFKNKIEGVLKDLNKFDDNQKKEAVSYIQSYINDGAKSSSSTSHNETRKRSVRKMQKRLLIRSRKLKYSDNTTITARKIIFKCKICDFSEKKRKNMLRHLQTHVGAPRSCIKCKKTFNGSVSFNWHLIYYCSPSFYNKRKYKCYMCPREFVSKRTLESHLQGHKRNNCVYCEKVLTRKTHLIRHLLEEHSIKLERHTNRCDHCEKKYIKKSSLYYHLRQHFSDKFICLECGNITNTKEENEEHKKQHDLQKHFCCSKCGDRFSRRQQYLYHLKRHDQYKCITCNESFASRSKTIKHKQEGHQVEGLNPRFICPHCPLAFQRESRFHIHMRKHTEENRSVNCKYCKKTFNSPYAYYKHCITINHEKFSPEVNDIVCNECNKHFAKRYDLKQHMYRVHNISKQFVHCQFCNYKTVHKCNMDRHVALHFRKDKFTCEYCGKSCDSIASLHDHITYNHIQTKQFKCDKCDKSFKRNSELVRHQDSHSDKRPHICTLCGKTYKRLNHLKRHETHVHQIVNETRRIKKVVTENEETNTNTEVNPTMIYLSTSQANDSRFGVLVQEVSQNFQQSIDINECESGTQQLGYFLPERSWNINNDDLSKVYNEVALNHFNYYFEQRNESCNENTTSGQR